ncbi:hypothetical protein [Pseudalkalibacillus berkeleyi]|uniref:Uncharacterized protein n=1 Tax=Pseudalkalibacillus berkeleyi TaxID=1069813 RepID=A0ABS9H4R3_9BACL|nr:hypothetical protein [Pseudalkalibacillus berkeleyi]MCF6138817.1 hypothetical protein [Pseudalkalibacillus berkeleyi]
MQIKLIQLVRTIADLNEFSSIDDADLWEALTLRREVKTTNNSILSLKQN